MERVTKTIRAACPRSDYRSTLAGTDVLEVVYDVYVPRGGPLGEPYGASEAVRVPVVNIVFLHGTGMTRSIWEWYVEYLEAETMRGRWPFRLGKLITVDQVNHGDSGVVNRGKLGTTFHWVDGARDVVKIRELELFGEGQQLQAFNSYNVLVGHSMGGHQALACGVLSPNMFQLIIGMEPVVKMVHKSGKGRPIESDIRLGPESIGSTMSLNYFKAISRKVEDTFDDKEGYIEFMRKRSFWTNADERILERFCEAEYYLEEVKQPQSPASVRVKTKTAKDQHLISYMCLYPYAVWLMNNLQWIKTPVVCLVGAKSQWCPPENYQLFQERIRNYQRITIPDVDHLMNIENPDTIAPLLLSHIRNGVSNANRDQLHTNRDDFGPLYTKFKAESIGRSSHAKPKPKPKPKLSKL